MDAPPLDYCRQIEAYLCRKNDGHLIRVVGPSFDLVSAWASQGIPLKVACEGVDRAFERYHRKGPRRRPLKIDFCEADVLDVFDEWRRAVGITAVAGARDEEASSGATARKGPSLPSHLERVVRRLSDRRASGALGDAFDGLIDRIALELDRARSGSRGIRGDERRALVERLAVLDRELVEAAHLALGGPARDAIDAEAVRELAPYRDRMAPDAYARARAAAGQRLVRERLGLPTVSV